MLYKNWTIICELMNFLAGCGTSYIAMRILLWEMNWKMRLIDLASWKDVSYILVVQILLEILEESPRWSHNNLFGPVFVFIQELNWLSSASFCFFDLLFYDDHYKKGVVMVTDLWFEHVRSNVVITDDSDIYAFCLPSSVVLYFDASFLFFLREHLLISLLLCFSTLRKKVVFFCLCFIVFLNCGFPFVVCSCTPIYVLHAYVRLIDFELKACKMLACWSF